LPVIFILILVPARRLHLRVGSAIVALQRP
jgi:hypothetical protein